MDQDYFYFSIFSFPQYELGSLLSPPTPIPQHGLVSLLPLCPTRGNTTQNLYGIKAQARDAVGIVPVTPTNTNHTLESELENQPVWDSVP